MDILTLIQVIQYTNEHPPLIHSHDVKYSLSLILHPYDNIISHKLYHLPLSLDLTHMKLKPLNQNAITFFQDLFYDEIK